ncbi:MAG: hypothetical protein OQJ87_04045, partial [Rhodospirillales bacterium]|nr:hypothetical protein [Rhodospirillales bacterium]
MPEMPEGQRFYVISPDNAVVHGFAVQAGAEAAAVAFGEDAHVVDTMAGAYAPSLFRVIDGKMVVDGQGLFDYRLGLETNLVESANRRALPIVLALLKKGADPNGRDAKGRSALN